MQVEAPHKKASESATDLGALDHPLPKETIATATPTRAASHACFHGEPDLMQSAPDNTQADHPRNMAERDALAHAQEHACLGRTTVLAHALFHLFMRTLQPSKSDNISRHPLSLKGIRTPNTPAFRRNLGRMPIASRLPRL